MTAGVFSLQNTIGYASESSGRKIVTIVFDDSFSMANENRYSNANYAIQAFIALVSEHLPEGPMWFPEDMETDALPEDLVAEFVREKLC